MRTIVLVGFPGSGKSTVGRRLASRLSIPFFDTDSYFEKKYHITIPDFFCKYGESYFRICERAVLEELLSLPSCVVATGGGTPCYADSMQLINSSAISVYIKMAPKSLLERLSLSKKERPLLSGKTPGQIADFIAEAFPVRESYYSQARICVKGESLQLDPLIETLLQVSDFDVTLEKD